MSRPLPHLPLQPRLVDPPGTGPCAKQVVRATLVCEDGTQLVGTNCCRNPQAACPRAGMPTGVGYELCERICRQVGHAEAVVLAAAGQHARGATLFVEGHTYACRSCRALAAAAAVREVCIGKPPDPGMRS